jgi:hypothetical protein
VEIIWIIGAGRFGRHAAAGLSAGRTDRRLVLVDPSEKSLADAEGPGRTLVQADGSAYLTRHLHPEAGPDAPVWIVPAVPVHLPAEWCLARLGPERLRRHLVPPDVQHLLPNPIDGLRGDVYVSHARFRCPADCSEPEDTCTVTRKPRAQNLFEVLEGLKVPPNESLVVRSHQLGAGVGGYRPAQLCSLLSRLERSGPRLLVSTACRCHGVVTALERLA